MANAGGAELKAIAGDVSPAASIVHEANDATAPALVAVLAAGRVSSPSNVHATSAAGSPPVNAAASAAAANLIFPVVMCVEPFVPPPRRANPNAGSDNDSTSSRFAGQEKYYQLGKNKTTNSEFLFLPLPPPERRRSKSAAPCQGTVSQRRGCRRSCRQAVNTESRRAKFAVNGAAFPVCGLHRKPRCVCEFRDCHIRHCLHHGQDFQVSFHVSSGTNAAM